MNKSGADPGILVGGAWIFSKVWGLGAALRPPMGPTMGPPMDNALMGAQEAKPPEAPEF